MTVMVTAKKIAEAAHVSRSTVQRALSGNPKVSSETKTRILRLAKALGYRPNKHARALVMRRQEHEYAVILTVPENSFMQEILKGINKAQAELKDFGVKVSIHFMDTIDGRRQANLIDQLVAASVKGIVLISIDCDEVRQAINNGFKKGITFITLATDIQHSKRLCFVGQDNYRSGQVAGGLMSMLIQRGEKIACFIGSKQFLGHEERLAGFRERYLQCHDAQDIVKVVENFDSSYQSEQLTRDLIVRNPDLRGIFVAGGGVEGVCKTVKEMGQNGKIRMLTYDLVQSRQFCLDGVVDFIIDQDPIMEGYRALSILNSFVMYKEIPQGMQLTKIDIRIRDNLESERGEM
jgi:LacI family transcriptional regulator